MLELVNFTQYVLTILLQELKAKRRKRNGVRHAMSQTLDSISLKVRMKAEGMAQELLPSKHKALSSTPP
jgi:hypothetical protein